MIGSPTCKLGEKIKSDFILPNKKHVELLINEYIQANGLSFSLREQVSELMEEERKPFGNVFLIIEMD